ncbi:heavy metal-associated isoprenylated plant protein 7-like [Musa acuminata AAA Group]|uniref:heavy metal-associated isoprenylated plant protein 7-like n=1 Tax=Musa acuminata AAA Group TaxID=214697 RepID=UPI0031D53E60
MEYAERSNLEQEEKQLEEDGKKEWRPEGGGGQPHAPCGGEGEEGRGGSDEVVERVQKKNGRKVELLSPLPPPPQPEKKEQEKRSEEKHKAEEEKETRDSDPKLRSFPFDLECSKKGGIFLVETGVQTAEATVKGVFDSASLVAYVHKRQAAVVKQETEEKTKAAEKEKKAEGEKDVKTENGLPFDQ